MVVAKLFVAPMLMLVGLSTAQQLTWRRLDDGNISIIPPGRRDHAMGYDGVRNRMIVFGGRGTQVYGDTWSFDLNNNTWTQINVTYPDAPERRFSTVYGVSNDFFYVSTGQEGSNLYDDIWRFNLTSNTWQRLSPTGKKPGTIYGAGGGFYTNTSTHFFLTHGFSTKVRYANTLMYDTIRNEWIEIFPDESNYVFGHPSSRCLHSGTMVGEDRLLMYGGCSSGGGTGGHCPGFDSWLFSSSKKSWVHLEDCASPRVYSSLVLLPVVGKEKRAVLYGGGEDNSEVLEVNKAQPDQLAILDINSEKWELRKVSGQIPSKRVGTSMVRHPQGAIMMGGSGLSDIWTLEGDTTASDNTPKHAQKCKTPYHGTLNLIMLHAVFMVIGWGILLQAGAFIARYLRFKDPLWFHLHRVFQVTGLLFTIAGLITAVRSVRFDHFKFGHGGLGLFIMILGLQQPLNAIIRPHKDGEATLKRKIWEIYHINGGRIALILAVVNISLGLLQAQARVSHHIAWHTYVALFVILYIVMEINLQFNRKYSKTNRMEMK